MGGHEEWNLLSLGHVLLEAGDVPDQHSLVHGHGLALGPAEAQTERKRGVDVCVCVRERERQRSEGLLTNSNHASLLKLQA
jgi:hypothetical protein